MASNVTGVLIDGASASRSVVFHVDIPKTTVYTLVVRYQVGICPSVLGDDGKLTMYIFGQQWCRTFSHANVPTLFKALRSGKPNKRILMARAEGNSPSPFNFHGLICECLI